MSECSRGLLIGRTGGGSKRRTRCRQITLHAFELVCKQYRTMAGDQAIVLQWTLNATLKIRNRGSPHCMVCTHRARIDQVTKKKGQRKNGHRMRSLRLSYVITTHNIEWKMKRLVALTQHRKGNEVQVNNKLHAGSQTIKKNKKSTQCIMPSNGLVNGVRSNKRCLWMAKLRLKKAGFQRLIMYIEALKRETQYE